jgi:hypothetical protein
MHREYAIISAKAPEDCGPFRDAALVLLGAACPATPGEFGALEHPAAITTRATNVTSGTVGSRSHLGRRQPAPPGRSRLSVAAWSKV